MISDTVLLDPRAKSVPTGWLEPLRSYEDYLRAGGASAQTIRLRLAIGRRCARALGGSPREVTETALVHWLAGRDWAPETRRAAQASLRAMWSAWVKSGHVDEDVTGDLPKVRPPRHRPRPLQDATYTGALMRADRRTWLILRLASECGLRRGEIAQLGDADLIDDLAGTSLEVHGKGGKTRVIPLTDEMARLLRAACRDGGGWAFPGAIDGHLSAGHVGVLASRALQTATLHQGRHRFATQALRKTGNIMVVKELMGHESLSTTQVYLGIDQDELRAAVEAVAA